MSKLLNWAFGRFAPMERSSAGVVIIFGLAMLVVRVLLARPFWNSGQTRWVDLPWGFLTKPSSNTAYLFENLFMLNFPWGSYPIPFATATAYLTSVAEIVLPILVVVGLGTRLGALALFGMTLVIQLVFPAAFWHPETFLDSHSAWFLFSALVIVFGPGVFSLDTLIRRAGFGRFKS